MSKLKKNCILNLIVDTKCIFDALVVMMKKIAVLFFCFIFWFVGIAQNRDIIVDWSSFNLSNKLVNTSDKTTKKRNKSSHLWVNKTLCSFSQQWKDNALADSKTLKISNLKYQPLNASELSKINTGIIPSQLNATIKSGIARGVIYTTLSFSPIVKIDGIYKKVVSLTVSYSKKQVKNANNVPSITNSVLAAGKWYQFKVTKTGIYRISRDFLEQLGMDVGNINPENLKIYGNGGKPLPLLNIANNYFDPPENAIQVIGEEDGSFDAGDYILFYAIGTQGYDPENDTNLNPYSDDAYYFITADGEPGKRVLPMQEPTGNATTLITQFNEYQFHEEDEYTPAKVGRRWFGNRFDVESEQSYEFNFPNIVNGSEMVFTIKAGAVSESVTSLAISVNGTALPPLSFNPVNDITLLSTNNSQTTIPAGSETITVDLAYNNSGNPASTGYLDYLKIDVIRQLAGVEGEQLAFQYNDAINATGVGEYQISNASQFTQIWDVTDFTSITSKTFSGNATVSFKAQMGELRKYIALNPNDYYTPERAEDDVLQNQNLKGEIFQDASGNFNDVDYIIVVAPFLIQPALKLANHRKNIDGLNVKVVTTSQIYNEFSTGKQDISAIRNFIRYVYENASDSSKRIKYLCLFGDTSVDYKNRISGNNNIVPTFHTLNSTNTVSSFMSDDFYGNLDFNEGTIGQNPDVDRLDIAVGRILTDNVPLANALVDKIINYESKNSYGNWRNNFVIISDDVDEAWEYTSIQKNLDDLSDEILAEKPFLNVKKIHSDAFQQESSAGGDRYPKVNQAIQDAIEVGALIVNYFGHGGEDGLAKEFIYTKTMGEEFQNYNNLPCILTVTCEFTKFDLPTRITAGELTFWNKKGGAISMLTTTRSISVSLGVEFNRVIAPHLFGYGENIPVPPAEALRLSKNEINSSLRRVVFYLGDPAMKLAFPKPRIVLTKLNNQPIAQSTTVLEALSKVKFEGEIQDENGNLLTNYNGILEAKVFDKEILRQTLGNDGVRDTNADIDGDGDTNNILKLNFKTLGEIIFNGKASITNGTFTFEFVVPKDIRIPVDNGRVSLYAQRTNTLEDQIGFNVDVKVGGINEDAPEDNTGPTIELFMNDESFVSGGITNDSPILLAKLEDENGINTTGGIGHDIIAILDGDETNPFVLNEYYQAETDDYTKGSLDYKLRNLEEGLHTLTLRAWDVYNNSATAEIQFVVAGSDELKITRVLNYPNPFINYTEFWFNHNRPFEPLEVQVQVFTVTGKVVWSKNQIITTDGFLSRDITWDGRDDFGDKIGKGVYIYKITVKSTLTNKRVEKYEKLVIL